MRTYYTSQIIPPETNTYYVPAPKTKNIGSSSNNSTITCKFQYAQTIRNNSPSTYTVGSTRYSTCANMPKPY